MEAAKSELYQGYLPLEQALEDVPLGRYQRAELRLLVILIGVFRPLYWAVRKVLGRPYTVMDDLDQVRDIPSPTRGTRTQESHGEHYLTEEQIKTYERDAVIGPLPLLSQEEVRAAREFVTAAHEADWYGKHPIGTETVTQLKANGLWDMNHGGLWQARNFDEIKDVALHPVLAQRMASLVGDDVVVWRSQIFPLEPQSKGTFWHCATTFTEDGPLPALTPPDHVPPALASVTCWIPLEDVDETNGCMRIIPGSQADIRLDTVIQRINRDRIGLLMSLETDRRRQALIALRYSGDVFMGAQLIFDIGIESIPGLYDTIQPRDYPMRAGECLLFSSTNLHGSYANITDAQRLAMGIRSTSADVGIYKDQDTIPYSTGSKMAQIDTAQFAHGLPSHTHAGPVQADGPDIIDLRETSPQPDRDPTTQR